MFAMLIAIGLTAPAAEPEKDKELTEAGQKELKKFAGKWKATELHVDGNEQKPELDGSEVVFEFKGRKFLLNGNELLGVHALDPSTNPKLIDLKGLLDLGGVKKGTVYEGIYKFDGDKLVIAVYLGEGKRPDKFESAKDSMVAVVTMKKEKE